MTSDEGAIARHNADRQREVALLRLVDRVRDTVRLRGEGHVEMTTDTAAVLAPYVEAVAALESIIWASDGCAGHRTCAHSMEPWQRARAVLQLFWDEYEREVLGERPRDR